MLRIRPHPLMVLVMTLTAGCSPPDERLHRLAQQSLDRQAEQNQQMGNQTHEIAKATRELVEADAKARKEVISLQADLQKDVGQERSSLDRQHEDLEKERIQIAAQRHRDPIIAAAIADAAILLACLAPLLLCWLVLRCLREEPLDAAVGELLIQEIVSDDSLLLPRTVEHDRQHALAHQPDDQAA